MQRQHFATFALLVATLLAGCASNPTPAANVESGGTPPHLTQAIDTIPIGDWTPPTSIPTGEGRVPASTQCPPAGAPRIAYDAAGAANERLFDAPFTITARGTMEGISGEVTIANDPTNHALLFQFNTDAAQHASDLRVAGTEWSARVPGAGATYQGRDHNPGARYDLAVPQTQGALLSVERPIVKLITHAPYADYKVSCGELDGQPMLLFERQVADGYAWHVIERYAPHRPLEGGYLDNTTDPAKRSDMRMTYAYDAPTVDIDTTLPRQPAYIVVNPTEYVERDDGGLDMTLSVDPAATWVPLGEIAAVTTEDDGTTGEPTPLQEGIISLDGATVEYVDSDGNGLLSRSDILHIETSAGVDVTFYDTWADAPAGFEAR